MLRTQRPILIRLFNRLPIQINLDADRLMESACKKTGLNDFGEGNLKEALSRLIEAINKEANLHLFGRFITKERILNVLQNRLHVEDTFKRFPEIAEIEIKAPIVIT